jgi:hypothetical protein
VLERAVEHGDEHVMKFADTAADVFDRTADRDALAAATRVRVRSAAHKTGTYRCLPWTKTADEILESINGYLTILNRTSATLGALESDASHPSPTTTAGRGSSRRATSRTGVILRNRADAQPTVARQTGLPGVIVMAGSRRGEGC